MLKIKKKRRKIAVLNENFIEKAYNVYMRIHGTRFNLILILVLCFHRKRPAFIANSNKYLDS